MAARLNYCWRLSVTGACFVLFSLGGLVLSLSVFPLLAGLPGTRTRRVERVRWTISRFFALLVAVLRATGVMRLQTSGAERLHRAGAVLVLANHPSYIDVVVLLALMPRATCVVKEALWSSPFFGGVMRTAGYIRNCGSDEFVDACERALAQGSALVIFPEGTRSRPDAPLRFMRGAAHVALRSGRPILPVLLRCQPPTLTKGARWYEIPAQPFCFRLDVRAELSAGRLADLAQPPVIAARRLTSALESYFTKELKAL